MDKLHCGNPVIQFPAFQIPAALSRRPSPPYFFRIAAASAAVIQYTSPLPPPLIISLPDSAGGDIWLVKMLIK